MRLVDRVCAILDSAGVRYALIGARALGARGYVRTTVDYDLFTLDPRVLDRSLWSELERDGVSVDRRRGDFDDPLGGVVHIGERDHSEVQVILGKWRWEREVIERSEPLDLGGLRIAVPRRSDLILLKLAAGGVLDLQDVVALLAIGNRDETIREVEKHIDALDHDARQAWERVRHHSADRG